MRVGACEKIDETRKCANDMKKVKFKCKSFGEHKNVEIKNCNFRV